MILETHQILVDPATPESIPAAVASLTEVGEAFIILTRGTQPRGADQQTYLQAAGTIAESFIVEYRDGCAGEHYRGDRRITADELLFMLGAYLVGSDDWRRLITWHRIEIGNTARA